jgi:methylated-DNA-[protein]-cysteine S-methyltransferase
MNLTQRDLTKAFQDAGGEIDLNSATRKLAERAESEGVLDVAYATMESPFGELVVAGTERGIVRLALPRSDHDALLEDLASRISPRVLEAPARLDPVRRELEQYFEGRLMKFSVPVDWRLSAGFRSKVLHQIARIPYGRTLSYGEVAAKAGNPRAFRAAGTACGSNPVPLIVPCHRVVQSSGAVGNYGGGPEMKEALLKLEGALST